MDTWTLNHMNRWLEHEFTDDICDAIRPAMIAEDADFWGHRSYWDLYDAARKVS